MLTIGAIVWGVTDIPRAAQFWSQTLDYRPKYPPSDDWAILIPREGPGFQLSLKKVSSGHARRHHLDLFADNQAAEVARLMALGAKRHASWRCEEDVDYVVLIDPDGNPFCVVQK